MEREREDERGINPSKRSKEERGRRGKSLSSSLYWLRGITGREGINFNFLNGSNSGGLNENNLIFCRKLISKYKVFRHQHQNIANVKHQYAKTQNFN